MRAFLALGAAFLASTSSVAQAASPEEPRAHLHVARTADAGDCPDAGQLAASASAALRYDAFDTTDAPLPIQVDVVFAKVDAGYLVTLRREGGQPAARTIAGHGPTCAALADAVVVVLALMLDTDPTPVTTAPRPPPLIDPGELPPPDRAEETTVRRPLHWYGWETLAVDAASTALASASFAPSSGTAQTGMLLAAAGTFVFAPIVVHAVHHRTKIGFADMGVRLGATTLFGLAGAVIGASQVQAPGVVGVSCSGDLCQQGTPSSSDPALTGAVVGIALGAATASVIDATVFARERLPAPDPARFSWSPSVLPAAHGATAGVVGRF